MSLVAYLPVVEVLDRGSNADGIARALESELNGNTREKAKALFLAEGFPMKSASLHARSQFYSAYEELWKKRSSDLHKLSGAEALADFAEYFKDPEAVRKRLLAWHDDRHQQPSFVDGSLQLEPAWLDFLVADLTCTGALPGVRVPPWLADSEDFPATLTMVPDQQG
jgi:hypothetical protein